MTKPSLFLASASPRRARLLDQIGVHFRVRPVEVDESRLGTESARTFVDRIARMKADTAWHAVGDAEGSTVLAADTAVVLDDDIFGKPCDRADCVAMLGRLSGRTHEVLTCVALRDARGRESATSRSSVTFRVISEPERLAYWESGEPVDKAGGYAIQGIGAVFVTHLEGSYSGVMGLPLCETAAMLSTRGFFAIAGAAEESG